LLEKRFDVFSDIVTHVFLLGDYELSDIVISGEKALILAGFKPVWNL